MKRVELNINPLTLVLLSVLILAISIGGRACGNKSKNKNKGLSGSSSAFVLVAPSNVSGTAISAGAINLTWQDNSNNEDGFYIERKTESDGVYQRIGTVATNINSFLDGNSLCPGNTYYYRIMAYMTTGDLSNYSPEGSILLSLPVFSVSAGYINGAAKIGDNLPLWMWAQMRPGS